MLEIGISKAYTAAFAKIRSIPVFNEFDSSDIVKASELNMFFNKRFNLCYGYFLKS